MTGVLTPSPLGPRPGGDRRHPDHSGIRLPVIRRRFVPERPARDRRDARWPLGGPPLRAA